MIRDDIRANLMGFGQRVVLNRGYRSRFAVQCGATVTTALTDHQPFLVALIRKYARVQKRYASLLSPSTVQLAFSLQR